MNAKLIAMAAAAAAAATSAQAADLPVAAEPVDYVQACDTFGAGYFKLPGKDTCVKIGGRIRANIKSGNLKVKNEGKNYEFYTKGYFYLTSMTDTEIGMIKTYSEFVAQHTAHDVDSDKDGHQNVAIGLGDAYVQFTLGNTDVSVGKMGDAFAGFTGYAAVGVAHRDWADTGSLQARVVSSLGNGLSATLAVADSDYLKGGKNKVDLQGALEFAQGWGKVKVSGAAHQTAYDKTGYAVNANGEFTYDMVTVGLGAQYSKDALKYVGAKAGDITGFGVDVKEGLYLAANTDAVKYKYDAAKIKALSDLGIAANAAGDNLVVTAVDAGDYTDAHKAAIKVLGGDASANLDDAAALAYVNGVFGSGNAATAGAAFKRVELVTAYNTAAAAALANSEAKGAKAYNVHGGVKFALTDEVTLAVDGSYQKITASGSFSDAKIGDGKAYGFDTDRKAYGVDGSIAYSPVAGLVLALDAGWNKSETTFTAESLDRKSKAKQTTSADDVRVGARVQYTF
ncbi:porin [Polycladidibacter hongkongensis]|uniref:porin n=1 Tax=Polycladidibacter hongkongensis TaxID=1647556 RepID=UPI00082F6A05|nr:porin [Pseudovibrio hongkongensis]